MSSYCYANITCGDSEKLENIEAKLPLHIQESQKAREKIEKLVGKKMLIPYPSSFIDGITKEGKLLYKNDLKAMVPFIEIFWCESPSMLLERAWLLLYLNLADYRGDDLFHNK
jgi:hypothetical protein